MELLERLVVHLEVPVVPWSVQQLLKLQAGAVRVAVRPQLDLEPVLKQDQHLLLYKRKSIDGNVEGAPEVAGDVVLLDYGHQSLPTTLQLGYHVSDNILQSSDCKLNAEGSLSLLGEEVVVILGSMEREALQQVALQERLQFRWRVRMTLVDHEAVREVRHLQQPGEHIVTTFLYAFIHHRVRVNQVRLVLLDYIDDLFDLL